MDKPKEVGSVWKELYDSLRLFTPRYFSSLPGLKGLISLITKLGFVVAYIFAGILADYVFNPALVYGGWLAGTVGKVIGTGETRGIGFLIILSGLFLIITALIVSKS